MLRALFIALCFVSLSGCSGLTSAETDLARIAREKGACGDRPFSDDGAIVCSMFIVLNDGEVWRLAELRGGVPFVEREFLSAEPERYSHTRPGRDPSLVLLVAGPNDPEYTGLWYGFIGADASEKDEGTDT